MHRTEDLSMQRNQHVQRLWGKRRHVSYLRNARKISAAGTERVKWRGVRRGSAEMD